jgi:hypothetical protein
VAELPAASHGGFSSMELVNHPTVQNFIYMRQQVAPKR